MIVSHDAFLYNIKDEFMIIQKQPPRGAPWERCPENMQQISSRTPMPKFAALLHTTLLKSNFGMGVLLEICCIFSEHLFLRTPLRFIKSISSDLVLRFKSPMRMILSYWFTIVNNDKFISSKKIFKYLFWGGLYVKSM